MTFPKRHPQINWCVNKEPFLQLHECCLFLLLHKYDFTKQPKHMLPTDKTITHCPGRPAWAPDGGGQGQPPSCALCWSPAGARPPLPRSRLGFQPSELSKLAAGGLAASCSRAPASSPRPPLLCVLRPPPGLRGEASAGSQRPSAPDSRGDTCGAPVPAERRRSRGGGAAARSGPGIRSPARARPAAQSGPVPLRVRSAAV